jgi:thioesterase domain-containing protein
MQDWTKFMITPFEVIDVPGGHMSIFQPPHVGVLTDVIKQRIHKFENTILN